MFPTGAAACLGCAGLNLCAKKSNAQASSQASSSGFSTNSDMTWEEVFKFAYRGYARRLKKLSSRIGNDKFLEMLRDVSSEVASENQAERVKSIPGRDLANFTLFYTNWMRTQPVFRGALVWDIVEKSTTAFEIRVSQCLWARTFRAEDAAEIGYASVCYPDYAMTTVFNPRIKMIRTKTLMQGHDCCNHRWVMET
jgi:hypothetical protein